MPSKKQDQASQSEPATESLFDTPPEPKRTTKQALLLELIGKEGGASLEELTSATGWLPHTARAAITGLRKRGHDVQRERVEGVSRYIVGSDGQ
jgi:DNA-binding MarR family transcriptional regulator